jgi:hypothetical protein
MTPRYVQAFRLETTFSVEITSDEADAASSDAANMVERNKMRVDFMVEVENLLCVISIGVVFSLTTLVCLFGNERVSLLLLSTHMETVQLANSTDFF